MGEAGKGQKCSGLLLALYAIVPPEVFCELKMWLIHFGRGSDPDPAVGAYDLLVGWGGSHSPSDSGPAASAHRPSGPPALKTDGHACKPRAGWPMPCLSLRDNYKRCWLGVGRHHVTDMTYTLTWLACYTASIIIIIIIIIISSSSSRSRFLTTVR